MARTLPTQLRRGAIFETARITNWRTHAGDLDVMLDMPDRAGTRHGFEHFEPSAEAATIDGQMVRIAALADVIASKEFADRPEDRLVLPILRTLLAEQTATGAHHDAGT